MIVLDDDQPQNVVQFRDDTSWMPNVFNRQKEVAELIDCQAQLMYRARAIWIGGLCLPWGMLSNGQRQKYRDEIELLVKGES